MKKRWVLVLGAACAACCAPLLLPLLGLAGVTGLGAGAAGWLAGRGVDEIVCLAVIAAAPVIAFGAWVLHRRRAAAAACEIGGACDPSGG